MDADTFDTLVKRLTARPVDRLAQHGSAPGSRRALLRLVTALPLTGLLATLLSEAGEAGGRRKRRRKRNKRRSGNDKDNRKGKRKGRDTGKTPGTSASRCTPTTCAAQGKNCGTIADGCGSTIRCGPDTCTQPADPCQETTCTNNVCVTGAGHDGTSCDSASCTSGAATPAGTCSGGTCAPGTPVSCTPYTQCNGTVCATRCDIDDDCVGTAFCSAAHQCVGDQVNGQPCDHGGQCQSGSCVDEVCCNSACSDACHACNLTGHVGTCTAEADGTGCGGSNVCCSGVCRECCDNNDCTSPATCGGGNPGTPGVCGCTNSTCPVGANCGSITNRCGGAVSCGSDCTDPATCGGGNPGTPNVCGCTKSTCPLGHNCGSISNVCDGGTISCGGSCSGNKPICNGNICIGCSGDTPCPDELFPCCTNAAACIAVCPAGTPKEGTCARLQGTSTCIENGQCCGDVCKTNVGCCPTCPSNCTCNAVINPTRVVCTSSSGSGATCSSTVGCPTGEACVPGTGSTGQCRAVCTPVG